MSEYAATYKEGFVDALSLSQLIKADRDDKISSNLLRSYLDNERETVDSLMKTAAQLGPLGQKSKQKSAAYDAAFQYDNAPGNYAGGSSTFQGFILIFFYISYAALSFVLLFMYYRSAQSFLKTGFMFLVSLTGVVIFTALIQSFA